MTGLRGLLLLLLLAAGGAARAQDRPILTIDTETADAGYVRPKPSLTSIVVRSLEPLDSQALDGCLSDDGLPRHDYGALLRARGFRGQRGRTLWIVRPALAPYCQALYGAHLFRYFVIEEQTRSVPHVRLLLSGGGDGISIYPRIRHGLNDIEQTGCDATQCWSTRSGFDGHRYRAVGCSHATSEHGREIDRPARCPPSDR
jgi:hypothetical protein